MYKRGERWYSDFCYKGQRYVQTHGPVSKSRAKELDVNFRADVAEGRYKKAGAVPRFDEAMQEHMKRVQAACEASTYAGNVRKAKYLMDFFGKRPLDQIENNEVLMRRYIEYRKREVRER
jgi:hypothetical protein